MCNAAIWCKKANKWNELVLHIGYGVKNIHFHFCTMNNALRISNFIPFIEHSNQVINDWELSKSGK